MHDGGAERRCLRTLTACLLLSVIAVSDGLAGEWEERRVSADQEKRADKITRDRITGIKDSLTSGGKTRSLADTAERASGDARALIDVYREQGEYLDIIMSEWEAEGAERRMLRESIAALRKSLERANADLATAIEVAETMTMRVPQSGVLEKVARIEAAEKERARWLRAQAALDRERQQRERGAAERERGVR